MIDTVVKKNPDRLSPFAVLPPTELVSEVLQIGDFTP